MTAMRNSKRVLISMIDLKKLYVLANGFFVEHSSNLTSEQERNWSSLLDRVSKKMV